VEFLVFNRDRILRE